MNKILVAIAIIVLSFGIYSGLKSANCTSNSGMVGTAAAAIIAHNDAVKQVAEETR